jgi:protoporphyrinogen oxidase
LRVAVVGGGAAGLAAAWRLQERGHPVVLFERAGVTGGLLQTSELGAARIDTAVQLLSSTYTRLFALATEAGARGLLVRASGRDALWRRGRAHDITYGSVASMAMSGALPTMLKIKLATKYVPTLTLQMSSLDANDPAGTGGAAHDRESIAAWGARELGKDFVEYLTYPLLAAYYGSPPEETSAAMYHALARVGMDVQVYAARGGMASLASAIADALVSKGVDVRTGVEVRAVERVGRVVHDNGAADTPGWRVVPADGAAEDFDAVVIATPPDVARRLLTGEGADVAPVVTWLSDATTRPAATLGIVISGTVRAPYFGVSFPRGESPGDRIVAIAVQQNKPAELVPHGMSAFTVFPSPAVVERVAGMDATAALAFLGPSIERAIPGAVQRVAAAAVYAGDARYRSLAPGFIRRIQELRGTPMPHGLALAGDYTMAPTVEGAVRSGERAAASLHG